MGRKRRQGNKTPERTTNIIEDSAENEENEHPLAETSRAMISMCNESNEVHKDMLKEEIKTELIEILMKRTLFKENIPKQLKDYQDSTNQKLKMTQEQLNELRKDFNKLQNESKEIMKKEINEINKPTQ
jgi:hypothetical protein